MRLYDAHNHLQDERFGPPSEAEAILAAAARGGVVKMAVNGVSETDWPAVMGLARKHPEVLPCFGCHPWYLQARTADWQANLLRCLDAVPSAIGEIGLDRWKEGLDLPAQEEAFVWQWRLATDRELPASIHCLQAWGTLFDLLRREPRPPCGFLLHSYGGPQELIAPLAKLGAYFSFPGYFAHERKSRQREAFRNVPPDRLLIETDAPDQPLPPELITNPLQNSAGRPLNHPANLGAVYQFLAEFLDETLDSLSARIEENFLRLFSPVMRRSR
ncbi:MAG TPA: TatD family hydrolase [Candidatus Eisenbacteria bacterium]|nr:TatD family hydrolase [Candidatus Eisenbacteria bacterium]